MDTKEISQQLSKPFEPSAVSWRVGSTNKDKTSGLPLAYIDARDVMERLDGVLGIFGWQDEYTETASGRIMCTISVWDGEKWIAKTDGAGNTDYEGEKGAISDAFKRAAVKFGIGRYLYGVKAPWVKIEPMGRSFKIKPEEMPKLVALLTKVGGQQTPVAPPQPATTLTDIKTLAQTAYGDTYDVAKLALWASGNRVSTFDELNDAERTKLGKSLERKASGE